MYLQTYATIGVFIPCHIHKPINSPIRSPLIFHYPLFLRIPNQQNRMIIIFDAIFQL
jgi:hypothetical protein